MFEEFMAFRDVSMYVWQGNTAKKWWHIERFSVHKVLYFKTSHSHVSRVDYHKDWQLHINLKVTKTKKIIEI